MIHLRTLGVLDLRQSDGTEVRSVLAQPKRLALLTYLAVATPPGYHRRDTLLELFWPDLDTGHARNALSRAIYYLRQAVGEGAILSRGDEEVGLSEGHVTCDAVEFEAALASGRLAEALELFGGELLPGFFLSQAPGFEHWLEDRRAALQQRAVESVWVLVEEKEKCGNRLRAQQWARRAVAMSPYDEGGLRRLMDLLGRSGDRAAAVLAYGQFDRRLREDLQVEPSDETKAYVESWRASAKLPPPAAAGPPALAFREQPEEPPSLVHREVARQHTDSGRRKRFRTALALVVVGGCVWILQSSSTGVRANPQMLDDQRVMSVAVLPFTIRTRNADLDYLQEGMVDLLSAKLNSAVGLRSVDPRNTLAKPSLPSERALSPSTARKIAGQFGADYYLLGSIVGAGGRLQITGSIYEADGAGAPATVVTVEGQEYELFGLVDHLVGDLMTMIGRPSERFARVASITTRSPAALRAYLQGERAVRQESFASHVRFSETIAAQRRAVQLDSTFALAYYRLAVAASWADSLELARWASARALRHATRLPDHYRLLAEAMHHYLAGEGRQAELDYRAALVTHPDDPEAWFGLGVTLLTYGPLLGGSRSELREALEMSVRLNPSDHGNWVLLAYLAAQNQDFRSVDTLIKRGYPEGVPEFWNAVVALGEKDAERSERVLARLSKAAPLERVLGGLLVTRYLNEPDLGRRMVGSVAGAAADSDWSAEAELWLGQIELAAGRPRSAHQALARLAILDPPRAAEFRALLAAWPLLPSSRGELRAAQLALTRAAPQASSRLSPVFGKHSEELAGAVRFYLLGLLSLRLGERDSAMEYVRKLSRYPDPVPINSVPHDLALSLEAELRATLDDEPGDALGQLAGLRFQIPLVVLRGHPALLQIFARQRFLRGEWLRAMGRGREALRWYEAIAPMDYFLDIPYLAPAILSTARIYEGSGELRRAREEYSQLVALWHDAEPELQPLVAEARSRLRRLASLAAKPAPPD